MRDAGDSGRFRLNLFGPFALYAADGEAIKLTSTKARALLAMLVMADNGQRTRAWLQDKLWGRVSSDAGRTSLRGELSRIRTGLGAHGPDPFRRDVPRDTVAIDLSRFIVDALTPGAQSRREFLEGLDIPNESGFEDWLRDERSFFAASAEEPPTARSVPRIALPNVFDLAKPERLNVGILPVQGDLTMLPPAFGPARFDDLLDRIIKLLQSIGGIDIEDHRIGAMVPNLLSVTRAPATDAKILLRVSRTSSRIVMTLQLIATDTGKIICNRRQEIDPEESGEATDNELLQRFVIDSSEEIAFALTRRTSLADQSVQLATRLVHDALTAMFGMSFAGLDLARANLDKACEQFQDSAFLAWRAYLTTHLLDDPRVTDLAALRDEAQYFSRHALEIDPYDPLTLSLLSHVHSFALHDFPGAREMMRQAKSLSSDHVMTYDADALLNLYMGDLASARAAAMRAAKLGRHLPFRYCFMTSLCMIDALSGNYESAIASGEQALQLQPRTSEKPYPPTIRYLAACYTKIGKEERAGKLFESLREADRKVGNDLRVDSDYVMPSLEIADFLRIGQKLLSD